ALLALSGSTVNVIVSDALGDVTGSGFTFFEFAIVGVPALALTMAIALTLGPRLLPHRTPATLPADFSDHLDAPVAAGDVLVLTGAPESVAAITTDEGLRVVRTPLTRATRSDGTVARGAPYSPRATPSWSTARGPP